MFSFVIAAVSLLHTWATLARAVSIPTCQATAPSSKPLINITTAYTDVTTHPFGLVYALHDDVAFVGLNDTLGVLNTSTFPPVLAHKVLLPIEYLSDSIATKNGGTLDGSTAIVLSSDGRHVLITALSTWLIIVDVARAVLGASDAVVGAVNGSLIAGNSAVEVAITKDDRYAFVSQENPSPLSNAKNGTIEVFELYGMKRTVGVSGRSVGYLTLGVGPVGMVLSLDGRYLYATSEGPNKATTPQGTLSTIDVETLKHDPTDVIRQAFDHGVRAIDTSPYYEPSEQLLGKALQDASITKHYTRSDYILMTKVGRIKSDQFDYSPAWVRESVSESLRRFNTEYLDVVFCHDVEFVTEDDALGAIGELLKLVDEGKVRNVGISGYRIDVLSRVAQSVRERYGRPVDVIQNWGQMNLQNGRLEVEEGLKAFEDAGVKTVLNASPLNIGLLRAGGVPVGKLGDFHPAPEGLRSVCRDVAEYMTSQGESLAAVALRYALWRAEATSHDHFRVCTITGISTIADLTENVNTSLTILNAADKSPVSVVGATLNHSQLECDRRLFDKAREMLGDWSDYSFTSPDPGWSPELKRIINPSEKSDT
ncbi:hypothetical protein LTR17_016316 [Elasticomyces elasticus]|nr:hypothetical protein LTR17_016316 [Elasticomyces elasticus]